jgi:hypothetical protein
MRLLEVDAMERAHYRRVRESTITPRDYSIPAASGHRADTQAESSGSVAERAVTQFIICGLILAAVLVMNLVDTPLTEAIRSQLKGIVQDQATIEDVTEAVVTARDSVFTIFGGTLFDSGDIQEKAADEPEGAAERSPSSSAVPDEASSDSIKPSGLADASDAPGASEASDAADANAREELEASDANGGSGDFRIDEDILRSIEAEAEGR